MKEIKPLSINKISYKKQLKNGQTEVTNRAIIPTKAANPKLVMSLDVTQLDENQRSKMLELYSEYSEYIDQVLKSAFKFEDWVEHAHNLQISPKWRRFDINNMEFIND